MPRKIREVLGRVSHIMRHPGRTQARWNGKRTGCALLRAADAAWDRPLALDTDCALSGAQRRGGLDPVVSLRPAGFPTCRARAGLLTLSDFTDRRGQRSTETAVALARKYHDPLESASHVALAFESRSQSGRLHLGISADEALLFDRLASRVLFGDRTIFARTQGCPQGRSTRPVRPVDARHFERFADSPRPRRRRPRRNGVGAPGLCRRRNTGACKACGPTW